jgi:hypothetical protein
MFKNSLFIILLLLSVTISGQQDTIRKNSSFDVFKGFQINAKLIDKGLEIDKNNEENDISYLFFTKKKSLPFTYKFNPTKYLDPIEKKRNFMYGPKPLDNDVMVVKHFEGVDKTFKKFKTTQNLGTFESNTKYIRIEYRDFGLVDGDRVRVFLNEKEIDGNVHLDGLFYTIHIKLEEKGYNKIDIQAINQGYVGPNTAEFVVYDDKGNIIAHESWLLKTSEIATLGIVRY